MINRETYVGLNSVVRKLANPINNIIYRLTKQ